MVTNRTISRVIGILRRAYTDWNAPVVTEMAGFSRDPYQVLIACLLSLRTKDETTGPAAQAVICPSGYARKNGDPDTRSGEEGDLSGWVL